LNPISLKKVIIPVAAGQGVVYFNLPAKDVAPGKYRLILEISNAGDPETVKLQTEIELR
jgi:hypothetical protein